MPETSLDPNYLLRWDFSRELAVDRDVVQATHRLTQLPFASDQGLQELLPRIPLAAFSVHAMGENPAYPNEWQTGSLGKVTALDIIDLVRRGRIWVSVPRIDQHDEQLACLVDRLSRELHECHVGLRIIEPRADLVLSSPTSQYYYGCDPTPSVLWQLRGRMRLRIYPHDERFIERLVQHQIADQQTHQRLYFEPSFDRHSRVFNIQPGQMISWPQALPYRIENVEGLNLSLRLVFRTPRSIRQANIHWVNRFLCRLSLNRFCDDRIDGVSASLKNALAQFMGSQDHNHQQPQPDSTFTLDADSPSGMSSQTQQTDSRDSAATSSVTAISVGNLPTATTAVLEN